MNAAKMDAWMPATPIASEAAQEPARRDPWGFAMGWRGYQAFSRLNAMTDAELAAKGLVRADLPRLALDAMKKGA